MKAIGTVDKALVKVEEILLAVTLVGMVLLSATEVILRNFHLGSIDWGVAAVKNITLLVALLGGAVATSEGRHLGIDLVSRLLKGRAAIGLRVLIGAFAVVVCAMLAKGGWGTYKALFVLPPGAKVMDEVLYAFREGNVPEWITQLMLAGGFSLIGFQFSLRLVRDLGALVTGNDWIDSEEQVLEGDAALDEMEAKAAEGGEL